jgi:purine-binding chemotaxis protein CheW
VSQKTLEHKAAVLRRRADALARPADETRHRRAQMVVAVVTLAQERYGLPARALREITRAPAIVPLPGLPPFVVGIVAVRGEILCAVDLATWLGIPQSGRPDFLAVVDGPQGAAGLLVDGVLGLREIYADDLAEVEDPTRATETLVRATTRDMVTILDLEVLLGRSDLIVHDETARLEPGVR